MESSASTMRQLEERQVESEIDAMLWSPKMDILALANSNGEVALYRLNWQRIWSRPPPVAEARCTALSWRLDGKVLCLGYSSGQVDVVDVENNSAAKTICLDQEVTTLTWIDCKMSEEKDNKMPKRPGTLEKNEIMDSLTKFPLINKAYSANLEVLDSTTDIRDTHFSKQPLLLVIGLRNGTILVYMNGFLKCAEIRLSALLKQSCSIRHVGLAPNLSTFSVLCSCDGGTTMKLAVFSMPLIAACYKELETLSHQLNIMTGLLDYLTKTIKQISESWEGIVVEMDVKLASYAGKLAEGSLGMEFLELLMFGVTSVELEHFLLQELTEKGLKKLNASIDVSYLNVQRLVLKYLHSVTQSVNYFLSELSGEVTSSEKLPLLGVTETRVRTAQKCATSFWCKGVELQQVVEESRKSFRIFFRWLQAEMAKMSGTPASEPLSKSSQQEITFIADFLDKFDLNGHGDKSRNDEERMALEEDGGQGVEENNFTHRHLEKVGQYLKDADLEQPMDRSCNPWKSFLEANPDLRDVDFIVYPNERSSLVQEYKALESAVQDIFDSIKTDMTDKCEMTGEVTLPFPGTSRHLSAFQQETPESEKVLGLVGDGTRNFVHGQTDSYGDRVLYYEVESKRLVAVWLTVPSSFRLVGSQFYTEDTLSLLCAHSPVSESQRVVQLPVAHVKPHLRTVKLSPFKAVTASFASIPSADVYDIADQSCHRDIEAISACQFAVSGPRKVASFLFCNKKRVRIYDMEVEEEDDDDEEEDAAGTSGLSCDLNSST